MIVGAIDVGTNSVKLLVARRDGGFRTLAHRAVITRLGAGLQESGRIALESADRTLQTLADFKELCDRLGCDRIVAVGTQALRGAKNARDFVERCEYEAGLRLRVISGEDEARLSFLGATADWPGRRLAALDVGGGSTELVAGRDGRATFVTSLPLGAVSLTERYLRSDPPTVAQRETAVCAVRKVVPALPEQVRSCDLVGVGGTAITSASVLGGRRGGRVRLHGMVVRREEIAGLLRELGAMKLAQRRQVPGLEPERADIILAGLMIVLEVMRELSVPRLLVSRHGLRRGLVLAETS